MMNVLSMSLTQLFHLIALVLPFISVPSKANNYMFWAYSQFQRDVSKAHR